MSKKINSPASANTLFKYFAKSPATPKSASLKNKEDDSGCGTPKSSSMVKKIDSNGTPKLSMKKTGTYISIFQINVQLKNVKNNNLR